MCIQLVEKYAACGCVYHIHAVDPCARANQRGHMVTKKEQLVGYACSRHSVGRAQPGTGSRYYPDSGYSSGGRR